MSTVLVLYATKMGGTRGIAEAIFDELVAAGLKATMVDVSTDPDLAGYDGVVLGSAIYATRWRPEAVQFLAKNANRLAGTPVWLFQSGPCGKGAETKQQAAPGNVRKLVEKLSAAGPKTFGGRLESATAKGFIARKMARGDLAGDFRDFDTIRAWAREIAGELATRPPVEVSG